MCELLMFIAQVSPSPDPDLAAMQYQQGMIITIREDGYDWSHHDIEGRAVVIKLTGLDTAYAWPLVAERPPQDVAGLPRLPKGIRVWKAKDYAQLMIEEHDVSNLTAWIEANFERVE